MISLKNLKQKHQNLFIFAVSLLWVVFLYFGYNYFFGNKAEAKLHKIFAGLNVYHPKLICGYGGNSSELETTPWWYDAYYYVDNSPNLVNGIEQMARNSGYILQTDKKAMEDNSQTYLVGYNDGNTIKVHVASHGVPFYNLCTNSNPYGGEIPFKPGKALIELDYESGK